MNKYLSKKINTLFNQYISRMVATHRRKRKPSIPVVAPFSGSPSSEKGKQIYSSS
jgi:hypothetical protein